MQGRNHDLRVWRETWDHRSEWLAMNQNEWLMGDPAYHSAPHCAVKYRKHKLCDLFHGTLPDGVTCNCPLGRLPAEKVYNSTFDAYRGRVEKIFAQLLHHKMFKGKNRLNFETLCACMQITMHTTAQWTRDYPQYPGYGNWDHFN